MTDDERKFVESVQGQQALIPLDTGAFPKNNTWRRVSNGRPVFVCPNGHGAVIGEKNHKIIDDGSVHPSVVCPTEGCDFHKFIKLEGWNA